MALFSIKPKHLKERIRKACDDEAKRVKKELEDQFEIEASRLRGEHLLEVAAMQQSIDRLNTQLNENKKKIIAVNEKSTLADRKLREAKLLATACSDVATTVLERQADVVRPFLPIQKEAVEMAKELLSLDDYTTKEPNINEPK